MAIIAWIAAACGIALSFEAKPTFNRDIAPIIFSQCVVCHHPGGLGPFSLINYQDVSNARKSSHASQRAVTCRPGCRSRDTGSSPASGA